MQLVRDRWAGLGWAGLGGRDPGAPAVGVWAWRPVPGRVLRVKARKLCLNLVPKLGGGNWKPKWEIVDR